ncbi:uncharacterized protein LOC131523268 [Onychostoma macrolepis]|uniref:uncharacterized protein LOC131523268 n=1 Tax=Onychostoma macrolepis TaxID=369639 RepID=UPI00272CFDFB|nr:uncharacterized protein LOC131523268 [Onychostoma macrolepis]
MLTPSGSGGGPEPMTGTQNFIIDQPRGEEFASYCDSRLLKIYCWTLEPGTLALRITTRRGGIELYVIEIIKIYCWVQQLSRIGGSTIRDCVNKVMNRVMSNALMAKFNMRGGGQLEKKPFKATPLYNLIQDAVKRWNPNLTESEIDGAMAEHLKHGPGRAGGGGYKK